MMIEREERCQRQIDQNPVWGRGRNLAHIGNLVFRSARGQDYTKIDRMFSKEAPFDQDRILYRILERIEPSAIRVATYGGKVIGCAYGHVHGEGIGVIGGLFMGKAFATAETAKALIQLCVEHLRDRGCSDIISMVPQQDAILETFYKLGFKDWQRKVWTFVELANDAIPPEAPSIAKSSSGMDHIASLMGDQDLIPFRFWYRRVSQEHIQYLRDSGHAIIEENDGSVSAVFWEDLPALKIQRSKYASYFLFDKGCNALSEIGEPINVREISFARGRKIEPIIKRVMNDAYARGIQVILLHSNVAEVPSLTNMNFRFATPRIILRSKIGASLDSYLNQGVIAA